MCGDYNSLPESGVAEFIQNGKVSLNHHEFRKLQYNRKLTKMNPKNGEVRRRLKETYFSNKHSRYDTVRIICVIRSISIKRTHPNTCPIRITRMISR